MTKPNSLLLTNMDDKSILTLGTHRIEVTDRADVTVYTTPDVDVQSSAARASKKGRPDFSASRDFNAVTVRGVGIAFAEAGNRIDICTRGNVEVYPAVPGTRMPDKTVFAGISYNTDSALFVMPHDTAINMALWNGRSHARHINKEPDRNLGHTDWRLPMKKELEMMFQNRNEIGGFKERLTEYLSGESSFLILENSLAFGEVRWHSDFRTIEGISNVRCVRSNKPVTRRSP